MGKNKKTETIVAVLIPVLVVLLMAALTVVLWDTHDPSGVESRTAGAETQKEQAAETVNEGEAAEAQTEKIAVNPILVIETRSQKDTEKKDTGAKTQEET